jgi:hypothetical protein
MPLNYRKGRNLTVLNVVLVEGITVILFLEKNSCKDIAE